MSLNQQLTKIKQNWLLILLIIILVGSLNLFKLDSITQEFDGAVTEQSISAKGMPIPSFADSFMPEVEEREIAKTSFLTTEIKRGSFFENDAKLKTLIKTREGLITSETRNKYETKQKSYLTASYNIKVPTKDYDNLVVELKKLGEVESFTENKDDITKQKINLQTQLSAEKNRLTNYQKILNEATTAEEKLQITDRIFYQERTIKNLEEALKSTNERVSYSNIYLTIKEEKSAFATTFITLSSIVGNFVSSINALVKFLITILPWAIVIYIIYIIKKRKL